jgi:O-antigen ligase
VVLGPALALAFRTYRAAVARVALLTAAVLLADAYLSYTRAALLAGFAIAALALSLLARGWTRGLALFIAGSVALAVLSSPEWRLRLMRGEQNLLGGQERRLSMKVGWDLAKLHPLVGVGFGNYQEAAWATQPQTGISPDLSIDAHNLWLTVLVETGAIGLLLTLAYHFLLARALLRRWREGSWIGTGALLALAAFHLLSLVHYLQHHTGVYLSFALWWGLGLAPSQAAGSERLGVHPGGHLNRDHRIDESRQASV